MSRAPANRAVPKALAPKRDPLAIHIAIVTKDPRIWRFINEHVYVIGPHTGPYTPRVYAHLVLDDPDHPASGLDMRVRHALAELGLVDPELVGFEPATILPGWPNANTETGQ